MRGPRPGLTPAQIDGAERIHRTLRQATNDEHWQIAQWLGSKPDPQIFGPAEFQARELTHTIGAKAIQTVLHERKEGADSVAHLRAFFESGDRQRDAYWQPSPA